MEDGRRRWMAGLVRFWQERAGFSEVSDSCQNRPSAPSPNRLNRAMPFGEGRSVTGWHFLALFVTRFGRAPREQCSGDMPRPRPSCVPRGHGQQVQQRLLKPMHSQRGRAVRHSHTGRRRDGARRPSVSRTPDDVLCQRTTPSGMNDALPRRGRPRKLGLGPTFRHADCCREYNNYRIRIQARKLLSSRVEFQIAPQRTQGNAKQDNELDGSPSAQQHAPRPRTRTLPVWQANPPWACKPTHEPASQPYERRVLS